MKKIGKRDKSDIIKYNINLPVDFRRKETKQILQNLGKTKEEYIDFVKKQIVVVKKRIDREKKDKKYIKDVNKIKTLQNFGRSVIRNKIFRMQPTQSSFKSYFKYSITNDKPNLLEQDYSEIYMGGLNLDQVKHYMSFYNIIPFMKTKIGHKVYISIEFITQQQEGNIDKNMVTSISRVLYTNEDVYVIIKDFLKQVEQLLNQSYINPNYISKIDVHIAKFNNLTGSSYIELPDFIKNKKACINIQNDDQYCFIYSLLCGLNCPSKNPQRVLNYTHRLNELNFKPEEMPMSINKIRFFEKRNNIRINVFGIQNQSIIPLYVSSNRDKLEYPLVPLLYFTNDENKSHYCFIKELNKLLNKSGEKKEVCPYCLQFTSHGTGAIEAMDKHMNNCISGQACEMPKDDYIKFQHFNNINECPIRIYADFEAFNLEKEIKSKNEKSIFYTQHCPASFKILVVSDIKIDDYEAVDRYYTKSIIYKGEDCDKVFVEKLQELETHLVKVIYDAQYDNKYNIIMSAEQKKLYNNCKSCWICKSNFTEENCKVRHHNHNTGQYHSALCSNCNIQIKDKVKIPVMFHNLNYDKNIFFKSLVHYENIKDISILPNNAESFKSFTIGKLNFIDTFNFMQSGLDKLISNVPDDKKHFIRQLSKNDEHFKIMTKKGYFPYEWFDCIDKLKIPIKDLKKEHFDNQLTLSKITEEKWKEVLNIIDKLGITTFEEYHDFYLNIDVNGLADVFENFRNTSLQYYKLDPCHYVGTPSFGWDAMLLMTNIKLELLKDIDMYLFYEKGIRGGQSVIFSKYEKANNKYMKDFDPSNEKSYISYLDANNLYGWAMCKKLPFGCFEWYDLLTYNDIMQYKEEDNEYGYTLEVDLHYPIELHDSHNDYPLAPEKLKLKHCEKLCGTFYDKNNYVIDIRNLKLYLELGMKLKQIHRVIRYKHSYWLKQWIDFNTEKRQQSKNDFEKDYFKLMNNAVFGKTMENVRDRIDIKVAFDDDYQRKYQSKPNYNSTKPFEKDGKQFSVIQLSKLKVKLDKPIYAGFSILDLSKYHMYNFHYNVMKPKYQDKIKLLMTDTDSLVYKVTTDDFYQDMYDNKEHFDMSEYDTSNPFYSNENKKVIGKFKDETPSSTITEFVGVRSKCYAFKCDDSNISKKLKGITKCVVKEKIDFEDYKNCVLNDDPKYAIVNSIRTKDMTNYCLRQRKLALSNNDDKRVWVNTNSLAYGYKNNN